MCIWSEGSSAFSDAQRRIGLGVTLDLVGREDDRKAINAHARRIIEYLVPVRRRNRARRLCDLLFCICLLTAAGWSAWKRVD
jgi:hypothetical protein